MATRIETRSIWAGMALAVSSNCRSAFGRVGRLALIDPDVSYLSRLDERFALWDNLTFVAAANATITLADARGRSRAYTDFMSAFGAVNFGHGNKHIETNLRGRADTVGVCLPDDAESVARWLCSRLGRESTSRVLFQVGGALAVSAAIALAQHARPGIVCTIRGGFHGLAVDSLAASSVQRLWALQDSALVGRLEPAILHIEPGMEVVNWDDVSCVIYEPVQGANGYVPLDFAWLRSLERAAVRAGVITIADEIQAGFYRHGELSPSQAAGLSPDIVLYSKSLTNGIFPLSAVVYDIRLEPSKAQPFLAHTFQTATLGYCAAKAVTEYVDHFPVEQMANSINASMKDTKDLLIKQGGIEDVFVTGPTLSFRPVTLAARDVIKAAMARGVIVAAGGAEFERVRVAPPLTIPREQLTRGLETLVDILRADIVATAARE